MSAPKQLHTLQKYHYLIAIALSTSSLVTKADELDTFQFSAIEAKTYDNNLFRRSTNEVSDQITTTTLDFKLDKKYSLQRFVLDLKYVDYKYNESDFLDFKAKNYNTAWYWSLTPQLTGVISSDRTQNQNSFTDFRTALQKNIRTMTNNVMQLQYSPHNVWAVIIGASQMTLKNSAPFTAISDFDAVGADYGLRYTFPSGSYVRLMAHNRKGQYKNRPLDSVTAFDNGYDENEYEVNLSVPEFNTHNFYAKFGHLERKYDNFTIRDYSAYVANVNYDLQLTGKLKTYFTYSRLISPFETSDSTYSLSDTLSGRLVYAITSKIQAGVNASYAERDFDGRGRFGTTDRSDKEYLLDTYISWNPLKNIGFKLNRTQTSRNSTIQVFEYDDTLTALSVELKL